MSMTEEEMESAKNMATYFASEAPNISADERLFIKLYQALAERDARIAELDRDLRHMTEERNCFDKRIEELEAKIDEFIYNENRGEKWPPEGA